MKICYQTDDDEARYIEDYRRGRLLLSVCNAQFTFLQDSLKGDVVDIRVAWGEDERVLSAFIYEAGVLDEWMRRQSSGSPRFIIHASTRGTRPTNADLRRTGGWEIVTVHPEAEALAKRLAEKPYYIRFSCGPKEFERHRYFLSDYSVEFEPGVLIISGLREPRKSQ